MPSRDEGSESLDEPGLPSRREWRVVTSTANYVVGRTPEEAAAKVMASLEDRLPEELRGRGVWKLVSVEEAEPLPHGQRPWRQSDATDIAGS